MRTSGGRVRDAGQWEDKWGDGDERNSLGKVDDMGRGDAGRQEDGWGDGDERSSLGKMVWVGEM